METFDTVIKEIKILNQKLDEIKKKQDEILEKLQNQKSVKAKKKTQPIETLPLDVMTLLSLPDHLRKTAMSICKLNRATAEEIAKETGRGRAVESAYLNQLVTMGYLKKERKAKDVYFTL